MAITSQVRGGGSYGEIVLQDWEIARLLKPSAIKPVVATLEQALVSKPLGKLSPATLRPCETVSARSSASSERVSYGCKASITCRNRNRCGHSDSAVTKRIAEVRAGLPLVEFSQMARLLRIERALLAALLDMPLRTLRRKTQSHGRPSVASSDRLARIKRIHELATHVLGAADKASRWLTAANRGLGDEVPLEMLDTDIGTQRVQEELREIEDGMPL